MNVDSNSIVIDLDKLDSTDVPQPNELLFRDQYIRLVAKIRQQAESNKIQLKEQNQRKNGQNEEERGVPSCFFIDGSRGSGKSTLLRAVRDALVKGKKIHDNETPRKLYPLADVDPTELGKGENFFLYLLGKIFKLLEEKNRNLESSDETVARVRAAMQDLRTMSGGLQVLMDSEDALKNDSNPDFFLENCIEKCADSMLLRKRLCNLMGKVAKFVGDEESVFLITIDDADLNFSKCEDVLEYVRKYMQSPRLIFLFAGDMQLYSHIVRGMYISHFHGKQLKYDVPHNENRKLILERLVDQYLVKLFPVDHRVQTPGLKKVLEGKRVLFIQHWDKEIKKDFLHEYLRKYLSSKINLGDSENLIGTILHLPARSVFFLLRYLVKNPYESSELDSLKYVWEGIQRVFMQSLMNHNVDYTQIGGEDIAQVQRTIFRYFASAQLWNSDLSLLPVETSAEEQQVTVYLSGVVNQATQSLSAKLSYWCACFPAWENIRESYLNTYDGSKANTLMEDCLKNGNNGGNAGWANLACASMAPNLTEPLLYGRGVICLLNHDRTQDKEKGYEARHGFTSLAEKLRAAANAENVEQSECALGALFALCRLDDSNGSYFYLSVFHLLMKIAWWLELGSRIIQRMHSASQYAETYTSLFKEEVRTRLSGQKFVPHVLRLRNVVTLEQKTNTSDQREFMFEGISIDPIVDEMCVWLERYAGVEYASAPADFSRAWSAFIARCEALTHQYTTEYIETASCPQSGEIFQKYMQAVEDSLSLLSYNGEKQLSECVKSFPFWKSLRVTTASNQQCIKFLNSAYIGDYINLPQKKRVFELKKKWENEKELLPEKKKRKESFEERRDAAQRFLRNMKREKAEKEAEMNLHNIRLLEIHQEEKEAEINFEKLMLQEDKLAAECSELRDVVVHKREDYIKIRQEMQQIEKIQAGESTDFPEYAQLMDDLKRAQRLVNLAKTDETRQQHGVVVENIREKIKKFREEQKKNLPKNAYIKAEKAMNAAWQIMENAKKKLREAEQNQFSAKRMRSREERMLSRMHDRNADFRKSAFEVKVNYEQADTRCKEMEKEVDKWDTEVKAAQLELEQQMQVVAAAEKAYEDAKKPDKEA